MAKIQNSILVIVSILFGIIIVEILYNVFFRDYVIGDKIDKNSFYEKYSICITYY